MRPGHERPSAFGRSAFRKIESAGSRDRRMAVEAVGRGIEDAHAAARVGESQLLLLRLAAQKLARGRRHVVLPGVEGRDATIAAPAACAWPSADATKIAAQASAASVARRASPRRMFVGDEFIMATLLEVSLSIAWAEHFAQGPAAEGRAGSFDRDPGWR